MACFRLLVIAATTLFSSAHAVQIEGITVNSGIHSVSKSLKYLISSFPNIKTVAYTHLPDTIWRPLFIGNVGTPSGVVADPLHSRLFVADTELKKIFWYQLIIESDGLLKTDGHQHVAVDDVAANWLAVNGVGDLYFSGELVSKTSPSASSSVYRMDESKIGVGDALNPFEVYSKSNTGYPTPAVTKPSGVAVDSFNVYWGNQEKGQSNGAVCFGTRQNIGVTSAIEVNIVSKAVDEVRGMAMAGQSIFFLTPSAVYGAEKTAHDVPLTNAATGVIQSAPGSDGWDPKSIAFDGEGTMYWTEAKAGVIYAFPAMDTNAHPLAKYVDAPQVHGVTIFAQTGDGPRYAGNKPPPGLSQSSARAVESGVPSAFHLHLWAALLSLAGVFISC